jgi:AcrR family transcriptional regulator
MPNQGSRATRAALIPGVSAGRTRPDQIRGGRHGLTPEQVAGSQRERVLAAMRDQVAEHSFKAVPVATVIAQAGVSRKTFYDLYGSKEECFVAVYERDLGRLIDSTLRAFEGDEPWADRLRTALGVLLGALADDPGAARICFVEVLSAGPRALARRNETMAMLDQLFDGGDSGQPRSRAVTAGAVGYLAEVLNREVSAGRVARLPDLRGDLMQALVPSPTPQGSPTPAIEADEPTADDATERAFLARYGPAAAELLGRVAHAMAGSEAPQERIRDGVGALIGFCAEDPPAARACFVEALSAGPLARDRRTQTNTRLAELFEEPLSELRPSERTARVSALAIVGGFQELAFDAIDRGAVDALPSIETAVAVARLEPVPKR